MKLLSIIFLAFTTFSFKASAAEGLKIIRTLNITQTTQYELKENIYQLKKMDRKLDIKTTVIGVDKTFVDKSVLVKADPLPEATLEIKAEKVIFTDSGYVEEKKPAHMDTNGFSFPFHWMNQDLVEMIMPELDNIDTEEYLFDQFRDYITDLVWELEFLFSDYVCKKQADKLNCSITQTIKLETE